MFHYNRTFYLSHKLFLHICLYIGRYNLILVVIKGLIGLRPSILVNRNPYPKYLGVIWVQISPNSYLLVQESRILLLGYRLHR